MALDYSKLTDDELEAIANNDYTKLSDATLQILSNESAPATTTPNSLTTVPTESELGPIAPQFAVAGPTGFGALADDLKGAGVFKPLTENVTGRVGQYVTKPGKAIIDAATMLGTGMPIAPAAMYDSYKAVTESVPKMRQALGSINNINPQAFSAFADKLDPSDLTKLGDLVTKSGGKAALESFKLPAYLAKDAEAVAAFDALKTQAKSAPGLVSRIAGPALRTAAKVAGPAGLALNAYDAQQYAQESQLGPRLAQGQGRNAQQAFRNMATNQRYGGVTPEEQAMLEKDTIDRDIRRKAAQLALRPIAPQ